MYLVYIDNLVNCGPLGEYFSPYIDSMEFEPHEMTFHILHC